MASFTKGKWEATPVYGDHWTVSLGGHTIIDCFGSEGNARIIAAAPEMYELLKVWTTIGVQPDLREAREMARELLKSIDAEEE